MLTSCFWVPGISFANGVIMLKSLCAGRLEVLERSSFDEVPSVFVFAIWADFAQSDFFHSCAQKCEETRVFMPISIRKKPLETLLWNEFLDTEGTSVQPYFKYKPVIEVLRHKPRANSSNLDEICKCLLCVCFFCHIGIRIESSIIHDTSTHWRNVWHLSPWKDTLPLWTQWHL